VLTTGYRERGTVRTIKDRIFGEFAAPGFPLRFSAFPERLPLEAAVHGEHNDEVLSQYLGYSQERIRALETEGVLKSGDR
jgi:crotonobetainyl-CoA:carnitine CoA-transferase CaiB-like acyl-CoA transferase